MDTDFPAAHSMDTEWFAVDAEGHVGHFYSSESGAVPVRVRGDRSSEIRDRLFELLPRNAARHDLAGHLLTGPRGPLTRHTFADSGSTHGVLMFLRSLAPVKRQIRAGDATTVPAASDVAVILRRLSDAAAKRLHRNGHCLGCFYSFWPSDIDVPTVTPAEVGLFHYSHPMENWIALPYGRVSVPSIALHLDQLPPDHRALVGAMRFDRLRFAETAHIQPCEWDEVGCWQAAYMSADGQHIREIEQDLADLDISYEELYTDLLTREREWLKGVTIDPPRKR